LLHTLTLNCRGGVNAHGVNSQGRSTCGGGALLIIRDFISVWQLPFAWSCLWTMEHVLYCSIPQ
jgi:hypothetical protein